MRDRAIKLAKTNVKEALREAKSEKRPWFRAQALSHVLRFTDEPDRVLQLARVAAKNTDDSYQQSAVRAWEVSALAERGMRKEAMQSLLDSVRLASQIGFAGSRAEALFMLFRAAYSIDKESAKSVCEVFLVCCDGENGHWRCVRALKYMKGMLDGSIAVWPFY